MSIDAIARDIAAQQAGATWEVLRAQEEQVRRQMDTYWSAYTAAIAAERQQAAFAPPPLSVAETAKALHCSRDTVYELIRSKQLRPVAGLGNLIRISRAEIERFLSVDEEPPPGRPRFRR